jgi:hypothetical protein
MPDGRLLEFEIGHVTRSIRPEIPDFRADQGIPFDQFALHRGDKAGMRDAVDVKEEEELSVSGPSADIAPFRQREPPCTEIDAARRKWKAGHADRDIAHVDNDQLAGWRFAPCQSLDESL